MASVCGLSRARSWWGDVRERTRSKSCEWLMNGVSRAQAMRETRAMREKEAAAAAVGAVVRRL